MEKRKEQPGVLQAELVDVGSETCMGSNSPFFFPISTLVDIAACCILL